MAGERDHDDSGEAGPSKCAKCGAPDPIEGHIVWNAPIRFKAEGASQFRRGTKVAARACEACGHIELSLDR